MALPDTPVAAPDGSPPEPVDGRTVPAGAFGSVLHRFRPRTEPTLAAIEAALG